MMIMSHLRGGVRTILYLRDVYAWPGSSQRAPAVDLRPAAITTLCTDEHIHIVEECSSKKYYYNKLLQEHFITHLWAKAQRALYQTSTLLDCSYLSATTHDDIN